ncbi:MAG: protein translocase subunit SecF, partial [Patescibacteria group bacterium]
AWAFRHVSEPVSSWKYGVAAVIALIHDVTIPTAVFAVLGKFSGVPTDALFITALLTIMGFSVHDTIVVFDRTRENLRKLKGSEEFSVVVNRSVNETFTRSINTSVTILLALVAIVVFGGESVRYFSLALIIGIGFGTYSSIFIASPLLVIWNDLTPSLKFRQNPRRHGATE